MTRRPLRRRPAAPGVRPPRRNEVRQCVVCPKTFVLDRDVQPWSRAQTCSTRCARVLGNRGRNRMNCEHCVMVDGYHDERCRQERAIEDGGFRDFVREEDAGRSLLTFRTWLKHYGWPSREKLDPEPPPDPGSSPARLEVQR